MTKSLGAGEVRFAVLDVSAMRALAHGDLVSASAAAKVRLTPYFLEEDLPWLWRCRMDQLAAAPDAAQWIARILALNTEGAVVGHGGFHGPPDARGMVELGYGVDPAHRRRGYARALLRELLSRAAADPAVTIVRAAIRPDNVASMATISGLGFVQIGEQLDDRDGLELIFERQATQ